MIIEILDLLTNSISKNEVEVEKNSNKYTYRLENEKYILETSDKELFLQRNGEMNYRHRFVKGKLTKSLINVNGMDFLIYILTKDLTIDNDSIYFSYNIYDDKEIRNLISSFEVRIKI